MGSEIARGFYNKLKEVGAFSHSYAIPMPSFSAPGQPFFPAAQIPPQRRHGGAAELSRRQGCSNESGDLKDSAPNLFADVCSVLFHGLFHILPSFYPKRLQSRITLHISRGFGSFLDHLWTEQRMQQCYKLLG